MGEYTRFQLGDIVRVKSNDTQGIVVERYFWGKVHVLIDNKTYYFNEQDNELELLERGAQC